MPVSFTRLRPVLSALMVLGVTAPLHTADAAPRQTGPDDAVVVAVLDFGISPYHWDYLASKMPQATNKDRSDDLPLGKPATSWLPGFPKASKFASFNKLDLSLDEMDDSADLADLSKQDDAKWDSVQPSNAKEQHVYWMPRTKIIGAMAWGPEDTERGTMIRNATPNAHGTGSNSVSVGNIYGTCPECLLFNIDLSSASVEESEDAIDWAMNQPWIDVITNSYGFSATPERDRIYAGSSTDLQRAASERGQTILFSAGNGFRSMFTAPNATLLSSQEGPDWIITVGATSPAHNRNYPGSGKPADIAGVGAGYPSAYNAKTVTGTGKFGGTSNATPTIAGTYARALYLARRSMAGRSRVQAGGVIARGAARCGRIRPNCELGDGELTADELRLRLFHGATPSNGGFTEYNTNTEPLPPLADERYLSEGHGTYLAKLKGDDEWLAEFNSRLWHPLTGAAATTARPPDEKDWMLVDSWCRQKIWGPWKGGFLRDGDSVPADSPSAPARSAYRQSCVGLQRPPR